jgi:ribonuclease HI
LRFDGACRRNPGPGGAGAALFEPGGAVVWTVSHYLPGSETNNTAEYSAMLLGVRSAIHHGATRLRVEGDSHLALSQVRGTFACTNRRLRKLRNRVQAALRELGDYRLVHIDRQANAHADRLANRALDLRKTKVDCGPHATATDACVQPAEILAPTARLSSSSSSSSSSDEPMPGLEEPAADDETDADAEADIAMRDGGEIFPTLQIGPGSAPAQQPRLRLRQLSDDESEAAARTLEHFANDMASKIADADDWRSGEGYISAIPVRLRELLAPYAVPIRSPPRNASSRPPRPQSRPPRPPRVTRHQREHRLDEALDDLAAAQRSTPTDQRSIRNARRRVGRIRTAQAQSDLRSQFATNERACVESILRAAKPDGTEPQASAGTCPIDRATLHAHFAGVNTPRERFDFDDALGADFRAALDVLPPPDQAADAFADELSLGEVEDQLDRVVASSSPGLDGVGYDVFKRFRLQLLPLLHAAYQCCWRHRRVPATWKVGLVRLLHKKGDRAEPNNWRPICLQQAIYKVYSGLLARRLSRWLEANERFTTAQKGFREFNGCHEHNFVASSLLDQTRRLHRKLYAVWYDLRNAFGSMPQPLMWRVLARLGVDTAFLQRCEDIYADSFFVVGNAADGATDPVRQEVGVYQGCPLSPLLFISALIPLLRALQRLPGVGVPLADGVRPCTTAYADDLKVFSDSAAGIQQCHGTVARFLRWTGLRANASKCALLPVTTTARGNPAIDDTLQLELHGDAIARLTLQSSYAYLGVGDGFDHVQHRVQLAPKLAELKRDAVALLRSGLAPWQVLKAIKVYLYPRIEYALRHLRPLQSQLEGFDRAVAKGFRHLLRLPANATNELLYAPVSSGGLGLLPLVELHKALQIAHGWQMLHSKDAAVQAIARAQVRQVVQKRYTLDADHWQGRDDELVQLFLNSELAASPHATIKRRNGDIGSLWSDVQRHLKTLQLRLETREPTADAPDSPNGLLHLRVPHHRKWLSHKTVLRHMKLHIRLCHKHKWQSMSDQGRTVRAHGQAGSHFVSRGVGLWDADYRFALQARLNQLDTNSTLKRRRQRTNATCRAPNCSRTETLAHVLNHCETNMDVIRQRHDGALEQIGAAINAAIKGRRTDTEVRLNQTVPEFNGPAWRPDIQVRDARSKTMVIADLAITFEDQPNDQSASSSLQHSREHKIAKYQPIAAALERQGWRVHTSAIVYGSLGSVHPSNFTVYTELLGLLKRDARRLNTTLSCHCIRSSRRVWNWHCGQHRARQHQRCQEGRAHGSGGNQRAEGGTATT